MHEITYDRQSCLHQSDRHRLRSCRHRNGCHQRSRPRRNYCRPGYPQKSHASRNWNHWNAQSQNYPCANRKTCCLSCGANKYCCQRSHQGDDRNRGYAQGCCSSYILQTHHDSHALSPDRPNAKGDNIRPSRNTTGHTSHPSHNTTGHTTGRTNRHNSRSAKDCATPTCDCANSRAHTHNSRRTKDHSIRPIYIVRECARNPLPGRHISGRNMHHRRYCRVQHPCPPETV